MELMASKDKEWLNNFTGKIPKGGRRVSEMKPPKNPIWEPAEKPLDLKKIKDIKKYIETGDMN